MQFILIALLSVLLLAVLLYILRRFSEYLATIFPKSFFLVLILMLGYRFGFGYVERYYEYTSFVVLGLVGLLFFDEYIQFKNKEEEGDEE